MNKFNRKGFKLDKVNIVNYNDKKYTDNKYYIGITVSNAITPTFIVYANHEQDALNYLAEYAEENELSIFIDEYELWDATDEDEREHYFQADNGTYTDLSYYLMELIN